MGEMYRIKVELNFLTYLWLWYYTFNFKLNKLTPFKKNLAKKNP